jgi:hypothetical protein
MSVRDYIAVIVAVLGVLLILAGATLIVLRALAEGKAAAVPAEVPDGPTSEVPVVQPAPAPVTARLFNAVKRTSAGDRLILWGILLLVIAAVAAGAITFSLAGGSK